MSKISQGFLEIWSIICYFWHFERGLVAILDHMSLKQVKGHQFYLYNLKALTVYQLFVKGVLHPWALFLKTLCIFSKNKATSDKVSYGSGQKCSKELKNHSFTSVETIVVKLQ